MIQIFFERSPIEKQEWTQSQKTTFLYFTAEVGTNKWEFIKTKDFIAALPRKGYEQLTFSALKTDALKCKIIVSKPALEHTFVLTLRWGSTIYMWHNLLIALVLCGFLTMPDFASYSYISRRFRPTHLLVKVLFWPEITFLRNCQQRINPALQRKAICPIRSEAPYFLRYSVASAIPSSRQTGK